MSGPGAGAGTPVAIGVDYGTESGRVLLLDLSSGEELSTEAVAYPHGVIDSELPGTGEPLGPDWALQHPGDYLEVLRRGVPAALRSSGIDPARVVGVGVDVTSCTVLPTGADGRPLALMDAWAAHPHAWPKLWKHHAAQPLADRMTEVALERDDEFLSRYGGRISSEWYFPKLGQVFQEDRDVYEATDAFVEATDWVVWQLSGRLARSDCAAGYKAFWSPDSGLPPADYFAAAIPGFTEPAAKLGSAFSALGRRAGTLTPEMAGALGLSEHVAVAVGNVDSFVAVPACGVSEEGVLVSVVGTSICDMVVADREVRLPGITGVVRDGILPGSYGYEAGQPAVGDMFSWYVERLLGAGRDGRAGRYGELEQKAAALAPGSTGLVVLDWFNGNRSILSDGDLSGVIAGLTLQSTPEQVYRALLESIAFGARTILDNFSSHGLALSATVACGGIAEKSPLMMQLLADVTGYEVEVAGSPQVPARGSALFGAVAAGADAGGFSDIRLAAAALRPSPAARYRPDRAAGAVYDQVYAIYSALHDELGRKDVSLLHGLKEIRRRSSVRS
ncbi:MAG: araB [Acidimicrobiaceae bacterium]|nr:araB [Acidimicrobiaceae bacterium]